jgi:ketosteroid isomerase-like protein
MRLFLSPLVLLASLILPYSLNAADILEHTFPAKQAEVAKAVHDVFKAVERGDVAGLEALHLYGPKLSKFDDIPASTRQDASAAREGERAALARLTSFSATVEDPKVDVLGSGAVATFILRYSFETPDASGSSSARSTMVFVEKAGAWRTVHEHFSRLGAED